MSIRFLLLFSLLLPVGLLAQGIKGKIKNTEGEAISFATIYIKQLGTGTSTNMEGVYEYPLKEGTYDLIFQHLSYATVSKQITVGKGFLQLDIIMEPQAILLSEVEINGGQEDPAYTIMRKAIAKAKYHELQVDKYSCKVYMKGGAQIKDIPFLLRKRLEKEGVDTSTVYLSESVSEFSYERPNTITEKVISIRTIGNGDGGQSPNSYIMGSFYKPTIAGSISPLAPNSFGYYRFKYEGSFKDRSYEINKIKVIPRVRGEQVFEGYIYITEDLWSLHSLELTTYIQGFRAKIEQIYAPVKEQVWMPVNHQFNIDGSFFGFDIVYNYLASVSDYQVTLNPDLKEVNVEVVDEKIEKQLAASLAAQAKAEAAGTDDVAPEKRLAKKQQLTRKDLNKLMKEYEKQEEEEQEDPDVVYSTNITIDSLASKKDSSYWNEVRSIPLSTKEIASYQKLDSIAVASDSIQAAADTSLVSKKQKKGFTLGKLLFGTSVKLGKNSRFVYHSPLSTIQFNTVEGWNFQMPLEFRAKFENEDRLNIKTTGRYAFARKKTTGIIQADYRYHKNPAYGSFAIEGGRYVHQFNEEEAINPIINDLATLLFEQNYMKLYEKNYAKASFSQRLAKGLSIKSSLEWAERYQLFNNTNYTFRDVDNRSYTPNAPINREILDTGFNRHQAFLVDIHLTYLSKLKYSIRNGVKREITGRSPVWHLNYSKGLSIGNSQVDFDRLELGLAHDFKIGGRGKLYYKVYAGSFLNTKQMYFMDYQHFAGNRTFLQASDPVGSFRLLDYYQLSTRGNYAGGHFHYQFRKLLFTQLWQLRATGLKENIILNYLATDNNKPLELPNGGSFPAQRGLQYMEVGYSLDNIFRFFRIEAIASFKDYEYQDFGIRIGISTAIGASTRL